MRTRHCSPPILERPWMQAQLHGPLTGSPKGPLQSSALPPSRHIQATQMTRRVSEVFLVLVTIIKPTLSLHFACSSAPQNQTSLSLIFLELSPFSQTHRHNVRHILGFLICYTLTLLILRCHFAYWLWLPAGGPTETEPGQPSWLWSTEAFMPAP